MKKELFRYCTGLLHLGCGGDIVEDWSTTYDYDGEKCPALRCKKCGKEILGDAETMIDGAS